MAATKNPLLRLFHIRDEIDGITSALQGVSFEQYQDDYTLRRAAERALQIISEATKSLPSGLLVRFPEAPWSAITGLGNVLRHEYQHIDDTRLWEILQVHLPKLAPVIIKMIDELSTQ
jgi:uncharacterized protein with HEPN domain